jgi:D-3-phosphoglycerate dehydrogenase / 2-oxoglutarate reductase
MGTLTQTESLVKPLAKHSLDKKKINILLLEGIHQNAIAALNSAGYTNITTHTKALDKEKLEDAIKNAHIIGIRSRTQLTSELLEKAQKLMAIGCFCIGTNQVDIISARSQGIPVFNAPFANTRSVAELVIGHIIYLLRGIPLKDKLAHKGLWQKSANNSYEVRGKTLGIIGYGHIGSQLSVLAENFGLKVIYYDIEPKLALGNAASVSSLDSLLKQADIISLHVPETKYTNHLIDNKKLELFKDNSILINASRGKVVDLDALKEHIKAGKILGAAIDVFPKEPAKNGRGFISPLQNLENVVLTPHIGGSTQEAQSRIAEEVAHKLLKYSDNGSTLGSVNFPSVSLPEQQLESHRILHIHENKPGILSHINSIFDELKVNVLGQYLQTLDNIGYVVMDISSNNKSDNKSGLTKKLFDKLKEVPGTVKVRVLY